jgi:Putative Flp pilus-assembly TadE/G-like
MQVRPLGHIFTALGREQGAVLVMVAVFAPVAIVLAGFAIDTGNWWLHKRHLQLQADAGALAAAQNFQPCSNEAIYKQVGQYSGAELVETPQGRVKTATAESELYNRQPNAPQERIHELINSQSYYQESAASDASAIHKPPCEADMVDVKLTETNLPWYMRALSNVPYINVHARVEIRQETQTAGKGILPVALADSNPRSAAACFVNEASGALIKEAALKLRAGSGASDEWESVATAVATAPGIAVRIALSGNATKTSCSGSDAERVFYDTSGERVGVLHIQGWTGNGTAGEGGLSHPKPIAREVSLAKETCTDSYFSDPTTGTSCSFGISAVVEGLTSATPGVKVKAEVSGKSVSLSYVAGRWNGSGLSVAAGAGSVPVNLVVTDKAMQELKKEKEITFAGIQRTYTAAATKSGPIQSAELLRKTGAELVGDANSFRQCEEHNEGAACQPELVVRIATAGLENAKSREEKPISLPAEEGIGNCHPGSNFKQRLAEGCEGDFAIYTGGACSVSISPVTCVELENGIKANDFAAGLNRRILGAEKPQTCTAPNHWSMYPNLPAGDPRIVTIIVVPFGSGAGARPIETFGTFYITGWRGEGNGFANPCQGNGDDPAEAKTMVGHFIKYVNTTDTGGGGTTSCEANSFGQCVAVLTR